MKDRDIPIIDFYKALQKEYICLEIRSKIYISRNDKDYFKKLMDKKEVAILALSKRNGLPSIIDNDDEYLLVWRDIVPVFGLPRFIYNIANASDSQLSFPYKGTAVKAGDSYGMTHQVNFNDQTVEVVLTNESATTSFPRRDVKRLSPQETDEYFYYYPKNFFNTKENGIGTLQSYNMKTKSAEIVFESGKNSLTLSKDQISRIL